MQETGLGTLCCVEKKRTIHIGLIRFVDTGGEFIFLAANELREESLYALDWSS
jgi:hypothetical protein